MSFVPLLCKNRNSKFHSKSSILRQSRNTRDIRNAHTCDLERVTSSTDVVDIASSVRYCTVVPLSLKSNKIAAIHSSVIANILPLSLSRSLPPPTAGRSFHSIVTHKDTKNNRNRWWSVSHFAHFSCLKKRHFLPKTRISSILSCDTQTVIEGDF